MGSLLSFLWLSAALVRCEDYVFAFGDSYTTITFTIEGPKPSAENPIGNPPFPGLTSSGGFNYIEFAAVNRTNTLLYDFGYGGAPVSNAVTPRNPPENTINDFVRQVQLFSDNLAPPPEYAPWNPIDSFFTIFFGLNDILVSYNAAPGPVTLNPQIFQVYINQLSQLYAAGARKFLLLTVPPVFEAPLFHQLAPYTPEIVADISNAVTDWNQALSNVAANFQAAHHDAQVQIYDTQPAWDRIYNNAEAYGALNNTCTNTDGTTCVFYDTLHPGLLIHVSWGVEIVPLLK